MIVSCRPQTRPGWISTSFRLNTCGSISKRSVCPACTACCWVWYPKSETETLLRPSAFNLRELVEKVVRLTNIPAGKKVSFSTAFPPDMPDLTADPVHVANVLSNLIENAIKYSGEEVNIEIVVLWNQQGVGLTVSDNGFGIAPDERRKVFENFYRSSHLPDKQIPGIGLGLSYVRQIVEAHHGSVSLRSELGEGTRITINLPTAAL